MNRRLHIYEEATNLFWGLIIVVCTTLATYILANSFITDGWSISSLNQIVALFLFALSFIGILKISEPLLHFIFEGNHNNLIIHVHKGEEKIDTQHVPFDEIEGLKFESYTPRSANEALFDFSSDYQLLWLPRGKSSYRPLIELENASFTLKVEDIAKIIRFIRNYNSNIEVPDMQAEFFDI